MYMNYLSTFKSGSECMKKVNCWEFKKCGREPGGNKEDELGVCPAAEDSSRDNIHNGTNAGRQCWVVAGTLCKNEIQGTFAKKLVNCLECDFYQLVRKEEGKDFQIY